LIGAVDNMKVCDDVAQRVENKTRTLAKLQPIRVSNSLTHLNVHNRWIGDFVQLNQPISKIARYNDLSRELKIILDDKLGDRDIRRAYHGGTGG